LSEEAEFAYKCTDFFHSNDEGGIKRYDPDIGIKWPVDDLTSLNISEKDQMWSGIREYAR